MLTKDTTGRYISIKSDGKFHETVNQGVEGAVYREFETSTGEKGSKWELVYTKIEALITNIKFEDGDFGENLQITFKDGEEEVTLSQGVATNFGEDLLKKLPAVDFSQMVGLSPYSFTSDRGKLIRGVSVYQKSDKVTNFFYDFENSKTLYDFPIAEGDTDLYSKDDWKIHFLQARKFLVNYAKNNIVPKFPLDIKQTDFTDVQFDNKVELESVADMDFDPGSSPF